MGNSNEDYADGKIDAERHAEKYGTNAAVERGAALTLRGEDSAAYLAGWRIRAAQLDRASRAANPMQSREYRRHYGPFGRAPESYPDSIL